jgi:N-methylhydantoinase A
MHAVWLARELQIPEVIVPWYPGTFSAWGMLQTDIRQDLVSSYYVDLAKTDIGHVRAEFEKMEKEGKDVLREEGVQSKEMSFAWFADMRYVGQEHFVLVALNRAKFGHSSSEDPVEFVNLRVAAYGMITRENAKSALQNRGESDAVTGHRQVVFDGSAMLTQIIDRQLLARGAVFHGPLVMEEPTATTVVPPGYKLTLDNPGNVIITKEES